MGVGTGGEANPLNIFPTQKIKGLKPRILFFEKNLCISNYSPEFYEFHTLLILQFKLSFLDPKMYFFIYFVQTRGYCFGKITFSIFEDTYG